MFTDELVLDYCDEGLRSLHLPVCCAMDRLFSLGFQPSDDISTLLLAVGIFVVRYDECRELGVPVIDSLRIAQGSVLANPNISKHLAKKGYIIINNVAGVNE